MLISGPNMGGKTTILRSTANVIILAQIGCLVPCSYAKLSIFDSILVRIGAGDDSNTGISTFYQEMIELSNALELTTPNSLLLFDELGRGTSTTDGLAITWSACEDIIQNKHSKCLFATHFNELGLLSDIYPEVMTYHVGVSTENDKNDETSINFTYKLNQGHESKAYGIHVAKMVRMPENVIKSAEHHYKH